MMIIYELNGTRRLLGRAPGSHDGVVVVKRLGHAVKVRRRSEQDKHVEDLVGAAPDVEGAREAPLGPSNLLRSADDSRYERSLGRPATHRIEDCAKDVHCALGDDPGDAHPVLQALVAVDGDAVDDGDDAGQAEADEHGGSVRAPSRRAELVDPGDGGASDTEEAYLAEVSGGMGPRVNGMNQLTRPRYTVSSVGLQKKP